MSEEPDSGLLALGEILAGKYEIIRELGAGGMGVVYEGRHIKLDQRVAIKMLLKSIRKLPEAVARFEREARAAAKLRNAHVAKVTDVDATQEGAPFMVMEFLEGHDLGDELERRYTLPVGTAVDYVLQACFAMAEAHGLGIVHRDLKPENLFLCQENGAPTIKVLDFGISKVQSENEVRMTQTASALGTPMYMSPEQIRSAKMVDARTDIWSLGVILYELIAGRTPFDGDSSTAIIAAITADKAIPLQTLCPDVPPSLAEAIMRSLEKHPDDRFLVVDEFAEAIAPYAATVAWESVSMTERSYPSLPRLSARAPAAKSSNPGTGRIVAVTGPGTSVIQDEQTLAPLCRHRPRASRWRPAPRGHRPTNRRWATVAAGC